LVVSEIKDPQKLPKEDSTILAPTFRKGTKIGYILSLGKLFIHPMLRLAYSGYLLFGAFSSSYNVNMWTY